MKRVFFVHAKWDDEAKVWFVEQSDIPGLVTEAPTAELLIQHVCELAPDLIELNSTDGNDVPVELLWSGSQKLHLANC